MLEYPLEKKPKYKLKFPKKDIEPQEVLLDKLTRRRERKWGISEKKMELPISKKILLGFYFFSVILILALAIKTFQIEILNNGKFKVLAQQNKYIISSIEAVRGVIYDKNGKQLVSNKLSFDLILDKNKLPENNEEKEAIIEKISIILVKDPNDIKNKINKDEQLILLAENIGHQALILFKSRKDEFPFIEIEKNATREYTEGETFSQILGYIGKISSEEMKDEPEVYSCFDYTGKSGLEKTYEKYLRKKGGELKIERDAFCNEISEELVSEPEPGYSLVLWLDSELQKKLEEEMKKTLERIGSKRAAAVAIDPKTGGILAMVSLPSFDNNLFSGGISQEDYQKIIKDPDNLLFNRAIQGNYATGSTIKPLLASASLKEKLIDPEKEIYTQGYIEIPNQYNPEIVYIYKDWKNHGWTDMRKAIAESNNVYFFTIGGGYKDQKGLGPTRIKKYLEFFGWGQKTGVDIPGETDGLIPSSVWKKENIGEPWVDGDTYNLSIGQGYLKVTPLQVAMAFSAIANGGTLYQPHFVKEIINANKNIIEQIQPKILNQDFVNQQDLNIVKEGMRWSVTGQNSPDASSGILQQIPVPVAAKTGTAEIGKEGYYNAWVSVLAPYENPEIVLTILVEDVYGGQAAALPVAKDVLSWYFSKDKDIQ